MFGPALKIGRKIILENPIWEQTQIFKFRSIVKGKDLIEELERTDLTKPNTP